MTDDALLQGTGKRLGEWTQIIKASPLADKSHKVIADFLHEEHDVSYWWAQEITVEYERSIGRRVLGQTQDGTFQIGVNKTVNAPAEAVWLYLNSPAGISGILQSDSGPDTPQAGLTALDSLDGTTNEGVTVRTTTYANGSHVRMQWKMPTLKDHSILQVRVTPKSERLVVLTFHHEKLPSSEAREQMKKRWREAAERIASAVEGPGES